MIRVLFSIYFFTSLFIVLWKTEDYLSLFQISRWAFLIEGVYFLQAARQSLRGRTSQDDESEWKLIHVLYEISFSFQLFNFVYYVKTLLTNVDNWSNLSLEFYIEAQLHVFSFVVIWCDQLFNLIRLYKKHVWLVAIIAIGNFGMVSCIKIITGKSVYNEVDLESYSGLFFGLMMIGLPVVHFILGCIHYEYKHKRRNYRRKTLTNQLVALRKVPIGTLTSRYRTL